MLKEFLKTGLLIAGVIGSQVLPPEQNDQPGDGTATTVESSPTASFSDVSGLSVELAGPGPGVTNHTMHASENGANWFSEVTGLNVDVAKAGLTAPDDGRPLQGHGRPGTGSPSGIVSHEDHEMRAGKRISGRQPNTFGLAPAPASPAPSFRSHYG